MLVDSHCHLDRLDLRPFGGEIASAIRAAVESGVTHMLCVGIDLEAYPGMMEIVRRFPNVFGSVGVHPNEREGEEPSVERLVEEAQDPDIIAIGETGLDYFRCKGDLEWQRKRLRVHIAAARACGKPLIVHTRDSMEDTLEILEAEGAGEVGGVMHCFTGNAEEAKRAVDLGFHVSFSGIVTFPSAGDIQAAAAMLPEERLLVETDSPYLAPVPHRGKSNHPAWVRAVAEKVAELRGVTLQEIANTTSRNFSTLFGVDLHRSSLPAPATG
ncbi:MAG: TatD family hydrolase [Gammaproteobacteria bacterium]